MKEEKLCKECQDGIVVDEDQWLCNDCITQNDMADMRAEMMREDGEMER